MDLKILANPFRFAELDIRTATDEHSKIRFYAKDVCTALDIHAQVILSIICQKTGLRRQSSSL